MADLKYLQLLAEEFPTAMATQTEIVRLKSLEDLPKGTEYFFSDIHGENVAFAHMLRSASGNIRRKIRDRFDGDLDDDAQNRLANLIYAPERVLAVVRAEGRADENWQRQTIGRLASLGRMILSKYPRFSVDAKMPPEFATILRELLYGDTADTFRQDFCDKVIGYLVEEDVAGEFIVAFCEMIQRMVVNSVHVIGDIFDRGSSPHLVMEDLMRFGGVDVQWGNHDVHWMAAAAGSQVAMASVLRAGISYNTFDALEHGYAFNLRALSDFASAVYGDDPCERFRPKLLDENEYDRVDPELTARMHKAIAIIMFKLEAQLLRRHPEYGMQARDVLAKTDFRRMVFTVDGVEYPLLDTSFPTIDPDDPARLTDGEADLMRVIDASFRYSEPLQRHVEFLYDNGGAYKCVNGNLLFHGCVPLTADGELAGLEIEGRRLAGRELFDYVDREMRRAYYGLPDDPERADALDFAWYLWCGPLSPMFGKSQMSTFENYFVADKAIRKEHYNPYYKLSAEHAELCERILAEFGLGASGHIVNGHVPVKLKQGETPVKGGGRLLVIDGGISKAYQTRTGIAGYTLIYNSHHLALAAHRSYGQIESELGSYTPEMQIVEEMPERVLTRQTDEGVRLREKIADLEALVDAYRDGALREARRP